MESEKRNEEEEENTSSVSLSEDESSPLSLVSEGLWRLELEAVAPAVSSSANSILPPSRSWTKGLFGDENTEPRKRTEARPSLGLRLCYYMNVHGSITKLH